MCFSASNLLKQKRFMKPQNFAFFQSLFSESELGRVIFIGGEPTVHPYLPDFIAQTKQNHDNVGLITNGRAMAEKGYCEILKQSGLEGCTISIHGPNAEVHDKITDTPGSFDQGIEGLENAIGSGIRVGTNTVISRANYQHISEVVRLFSRYDIETISFNICTPCITEPSNEGFMDIGESARVFEEAFRVGKDNGSRVRLVTPLPLCIFSNENIDELKESKAVSMSPCQVARGKNYVIDYNGDVLPCTHFTNVPLFNIFKEGVNSKQDFDRLYRENGTTIVEATKKYASEVCNDCDEPCSGGCPLMWLVNDPQKIIPGKNGN